ncbi:TPA: prefoldin subunit alpha [archaeon]|uniref:Prefoldin subunit alpha n=1 Tax=Candidatus Naiadarchaeum limnaeum TaxID=2756139 RepID=A0A832V4X0_9ARCH|nr:prefoldin subunit alpha [Candidatus Naiadarchaeales archaeon SRR2090153.bin1042]HIK00300.1 prefoldin subunit alpha [Candidatus Naiadarchaeum limnaeum]
MAKEHKKSEKPHSEEEKFQRKYMEYNLYRNQMQGFSEELSTIAETARAMNTARETLENFDKLKENPDVLIPIGAQTFAHAKITDLKNVLVNVGANTILKKDVPKALETISNQLKELEEARTKIETNMKELAEKMEEMEPELEEYAAKLRGKEK